MAPNYPEPGTIWKSGQSYDITWFNDKQSPPMEKNWRKFKIDFMTGDNNSQKFLKNVARDLDASTIKSFNWTAPEVEPHAAVYFLMFTNEKGQNAWTTRFGIAGPDGKLVKPENAIQPDGAKIPWGVGKLVGEPAANTTSTTTASYSMNSAMASAAENNAAVVIAVSTEPSSSSNIILPSVAFASTFLAATIYLLL
ncbi:hypothetical protein BD408DRAFT_446055 [Parasitella parasitica]|nr:hypothetical protein BD408DRAFT_446055 [Parasitella parasitica]